MNIGYVIWSEMATRYILSDPEQERAGLRDSLFIQLPEQAV